MKRDRGWEVVDRLLYAADARQFELLTSPLLLVECLGRQPSSTYDAGIEARTVEILDNPRVTPADFSRSTALRARQLHLTGAIKGTCDAIHLASAIEHEADVFLTFDVDDFPVGTSVEGVWIDEPYFPRRRAEPVQHMTATSRRDQTVRS